MALFRPGRCVGRADGWLPRPDRDSGSISAWKERQCPAQLTPQPRGRIHDPERSRPHGGHGTTGTSDGLGPLGPVPAPLRAFPRLARRHSHVSHGDTHTETLARRHPGHLPATIRSRHQPTTSLPGPRLPDPGACLRSPASVGSAPVRRRHQTRGCVFPPCRQQETMPFAVSRNGIVAASGRAEEP